MEYLILILSLAGIVLGADFLVKGAVVVARKCRVSSFVIGAVIVGIGTSLPELVVSTVGAIGGNSEVAIGNVVGSNIFNVFAILGLTALFFPIAVSRENMKFEIPFCIAVSILLMLLVYNFFIVGEPIDAMAAFLVHRHKDVGKLLLHLIGLVSDVLHPRVLVSQHISPTLALVATAENGHLCPMLQQTDKVFHMRGLARAAHGDIAHRDDRGLEAAALQNAQFEQLVSQPHPQSVKPAQWQKPFSNLDKVAFHLLSLFVLKYLMFRRDDCHAALFDVQVERYACLYGVAVTDVFHHHEAAIAVAKDGLQFAVDIALA